MIIIIIIVKMGERFYDDSVKTREPLGRSSGIREISPDTLGYRYELLQPLQLHPS